jgi:hypothetical protein
VVVEKLEKFQKVTIMQSDKLRGYIEMINRREETIKDDKLKSEG